MSKGNLMKIAITSVTVAVLLCFAGIPPQAYAQATFDQDLTIHETTTSPGMMGQPPRTVKSTVYMSHNAMKRVGSDGNESIVRFDQGKIITINRPAKTYSEVTTAELQKMMDEGAAAMTKNKEQMEMVRKMMGQISDTITVTKEGPGEKIAGFDTVKYRITGMMELEIWAAPDVKIPPLYFDSLKMQTPPNPIIDMRKLFDEFKKIDGLSLKTIMTFRMMNNEMKSTTVVDSIEKAPLDAALFEPPAGFKKVAANLGK